MTGAHSLFMLDEGGSGGGRASADAEAGLATRLGAVRLALATALAGVVVLLDELVVWAGQPSGDPSEATVSGWYDAHAARVLFGDVLWLAACGVLVAAVWTAVTHFPGVPRWTARAVGLCATTALAVSSLFAAQIALGIGDGLSTWHLEGWTYRTGTILLALTLVPLVDGLRQTDAGWLVPPAALVAVALIVPATSGLGLMAAFVLFAVVLALPALRALAGAPRRRAGAHR